MLRIERFQNAPRFISSVAQAPFMYLQLSQFVTLRNVEGRKAGGKKMGRGGWGKNNGGSAATQVRR